MLELETKEISMSRFLTVMMVVEGGGWVTPRHEAGPVSEYMARYSP